MNTTPKTNRRGGRAAALLIAPCLAALAACPAAAAQVCGCEKRGGLSWERHLSYYSNMVSNVRGVDEGYAKLRTLRAEAMEEWEKADAALERAEILKSRTGSIKKTAGDLKDKFHANKDNPRGLVGLGESFGKLVESRDEAVADERDLFEAVGGWEASLRKADKAYEGFESVAKSFLSAFTKAKSIRFGSGGNIDCVIRLYDEAERKSLTADAWAEELVEGRKSATRTRQALVDRKSEIDSDFSDFGGYVQTIAETLGLPSTATPGQIANEIADRTIERVTLKFGNLKRPIEPQVLRKGVDKPERVEPDGEPGGPGFLGWRERSNKRPFDNWDAPLSEDLALDATWGYRVHVGGETFEFQSSDWSDRWSLSAIVGDDRIQNLRDKLALRAPAGKTMDGWASADRPSEPLRISSATAVHEMRLVPHYKDVEYTLTFVVPDVKGKEPPPQTLGWKDLPRVPDVSALQSANGFRYVRWSLEEGGKKAWTGGSALTNDLTVWAVPEADFKLRFHDGKRTFLGEVPVRASDPFAVERGAPDAPYLKGKTFAGWVDGRGAPFAGGAVKEDMNLYATYRDATAAERIRRIYKPLEDRFPADSLACADAGLLVLLGVFAFTGRKHKARKKSKKEKEAGPPAGEPETPDSAGAEADAKP